MSDCLIAQISDLHVTLGAKGDGPASNLAQVLETLGAYAPDVIMATGDLVDHGGLDEYARLAEVLAHAPAPVLLLPGNHDDPHALRHAFADHAYLPPEPPLCATLEDWPLRLVLLDQTAPGLVGGVFTPLLAEWLHEALAAAPGHPTLIALHHPPFRTGDHAFDRIGLEGADLFGEVVRRHPQVVGVTAGHFHRLVGGRVAHAPAFICPSTAWEFSLALTEAQPGAQRASTRPGFMLHRWDARAGLASHAVWL